MLISIHELIKKYNILIKGILHVGAHECEELQDYEKYISRDKILWIEGMLNKVDFCKQKFENLLIEHAVISDKIETVNFNVSNNGQSSSILDFGLHSTYHPSVVYINTYQVETKLLKDIICKYNIDYNFINLDIQGVELRALKSMEEYLHKIDYIYTEVNSDYVYKDCNVVTEIDEYLKKFGFERVETSWTDCKWGDAFYVKKNI
jgi:FkbM family methyltransferase